MENLFAFLSEFLSYALIFVIFIAVIIIAANIGIKLRKSKDAKLAGTQTAGTSDISE